MAEPCGRDGKETKALGPSEPTTATIERAEPPKHVDARGAVSVPQPPQPPSSQLPWIEKYRPQQLADVRGQPRAVALLSGVLSVDGGRGLPHLLLYGPAGTGKTSLVNVLIRHLFGSDLTVRERARWVLELNASKDRGIDVMRERVKVFAAGLVAKPSTEIAGGGGGGGGAAGGRRRGRGRGIRCGFKLVVLDEADGMTADAQTSLRMTIETYSHVTRYVILCNRLASIQEALQSRCTPVPLRALVDVQVAAILRRVIRAERLRVEHEDKVVRALAFHAQGDARRALGFLQSAATTCDYDCITMHDVNDVTARAHDEIVREVLRQCCGSKWAAAADSGSPKAPADPGSLKAPAGGASVTRSPAVDVPNLLRLAQKVCADGYDVESFLEQLSDLATHTDALADPQKWAVSQTIGVVSHRLATGRDPEIQLTFALVDIARQCL